MRSACRSAAVVVAVLFGATSLQAQPNLVINGGFTQNLVPWTWDPRYVQAPGAEQWSSRDADGAANSGSLLLRITAAGRARQLLQCHNILPGQAYEFGTKVYFPADQTVIGEGLIAYVEYALPNCSGSFTGFGELKFFDSTRRGSWLRLAAKPPTGLSTQSIQVILGAALRMPGSFAAHFDHVYLTLVPPSIVVTSQPGPLVQEPGRAGVGTTYTLTNVGESAAALNLNQEGGFFTQTPQSFTIAARASQQITITATPQAAGEFSGRSLISGEGVPAGLSVPIRLGAVVPSAARAVPSERRIDLSAGASTTALSGSVNMRNDGSATLRGIATSDAAWLRTPANIISIAPGAEASIPFEIDRTLRSEADLNAASASAVMKLSYLAAAGGSEARQPYADAPVSSVAVTVKDSVVKPIEVSAITPTEYDKGIFFPGMGHVEGSVGTFISDLVISASKIIGLDPIIDVYFTPFGEVPLKLTQKLSPNQLLVLSDVVASYFGKKGKTGTLQIRLNNPDLLSLNAAVFNKSNAGGTYGTAIPLLRSDRATGPGQSSYLTGLIGSSSAAHTNLVLQETSGRETAVDVEFLNAAAGVVASRREVLAAFASMRLDDGVPSGAISARLTARADAGGRFVAYATPVDKSLEPDGTRKGGDTWVVADWPQILGYSRFVPVVIPVAGVTRGANDTLFRTDLSIMNTSTVEGTGRLAFHPQNGAVVTKELRLAGQRSALHANVIESFFDLSAPQLGYISFTPLSGAWLLSSRIFATTGTQVATFGTGVPVLSFDSAIRKGQARRIAGFDDAGAATINARTPATFRSNLGFVETTGQPVRVRVTLHNSVPEGATALSSSISFKEYNLAAKESRIIAGISQDILGARRVNYRADLKDLFLDVVVIDGNGAVIPYLSSIDNGSADQLLQIP